MTQRVPTAGERQLTANQRKFSSFGTLGWEPTSPPPTHTHTVVSSVHGADGSLETHVHSKLVKIFMGLFP